MLESILEIAARFILPGSIAHCGEITTGLINSTYVLTCGSDPSSSRYILQSVNSTVFPEPEKVMENILTVTDHLGAKDPDAEQLRLIPTREGRCWLTLPDHTVWRCFPFLEDTESFTKITSPDLAYRAAAAFGSFQAKLSGLAPSRLHETIPDFHNTPVYFTKLQAAAAKDPLKRLAGCLEDYQFIISQKDLTTLLIGAGLPARITHNDTKISNILFPSDSQKPPVVIDLDTVMPGLALFDYGDLVRSAAAAADEDEKDPEKIHLDPTLTAALEEGYLSTASAFLTPQEKALLPASVKVITLELAIRFLTDHLLGDLYFRTGHPGHNLARARNQLALLRSM